MTTIMTHTAWLLLPVLLTMRLHHVLRGAAVAVGPYVICTSYSSMPVRGMVYTRFQAIQYTHSSRTCTIVRVGRGKRNEIVKDRQRIIKTLLVDVLSYGIPGPHNPYGSHAVGARNRERRCTKLCQSRGRRMDPTLIEGSHRVPRPHDESSPQRHARQCMWARTTR